MSISASVRQQTRERAKYCCEYCHSSERASASRFTLEHVVPRSLGGTDELHNLALACRRCNERRYNFLAGLDPMTNSVVLLFNPRQQGWSEHFAWSVDGLTIVGTSPVGRATCQRLDLNDERYPEEDSIRATRSLWQKIGIHPPSEDAKVSGNS